VVHFYDRRGQHPCPEAYSPWFVWCNCSFASELVLMGTAGSDL
jgi:hypothetical protein